MRFESNVRAVTRAVLAVSLLAALAALTGCSSNPLPTAPARPLLGYVVITPTLDTLQTGSTRAFVAAALDTDSVAVAAPSLTWRSSNSAVATVNSTGLVTAISEGVASIIASGNGAADTAQVFVWSQSGWFAQTSNSANNLNAVHFLADGRKGYAVGEVGTLLRTLDAGNTWTVRTSGTTSSLESIWFTHADTGWAVGSAGTVMKSVDGGATWARQNNVTAAEDLMCVRFVGTRYGWIVGASGVVLRTRNGGVSWTRVSPTAQQLNSVAFADTANGWAVGTGGVVIGTHNGGASWYIVQPSLTAQALESVARRSNTLAWAVGAQGTVARTTATVDSLDWTTSSTGGAHQLRGVQMLSNTLGWAVGTNGSASLVLRTINGGAAWVAQDANASETLNDVYFVDEQRGWAVGDGGRIVHTSRGGQ